mgnify:CR=1 FL=1
MIVAHLKWISCDTKGSKNEIQSRNKKKSIGSNDTFQFFGYNLSYKSWIEMILESF